MKKDFPFKLKDSSFKMENSVPLAVPLVYTIPDNTSGRGHTVRSLLSFTGTLSFGEIP